MTHIKLLPLGLAALLAAPVLTALPGTASADVSVRLAGHVKVKIRAPRVRVRVPRVRRHHYRYRTHRPHAQLHVGGWVGGWVGGGVYIGGGFAEPPPPPPEPLDTVECDPVPPPTYTHTTVRPPAPLPPPAPVMVSAPAPEPVVPRFGLGAFAGGVNIDGVGEGDDVGFTARYRMTRRLYLEGELAKTDMHDSDRTDRRMGVGLLFDFNPRAKLSLHLLGAMGVSTASTSNDTIVSEQGYGEVGAGLTYRITPHFHLAADLRVGSAGGEADEQPVPQNDGPLARSIVSPEEDNTQAYTRGRLSALFFF